MNSPTSTNFNFGHILVSPDNEARLAVGTPSILPENLTGVLYVVNGGRRRFGAQPLDRQYVVRRGTAEDSSAFGSLVEDEELFLMRLHLTPLVAWGQWA